MNAFKLKEGFLIGAASAATQVEGGALDHSWMDWAKRGKIKDGTSPARANDHFNRWQEDAALMRDLGMQICRLGIEWARIEPQEGVFDDAAIQHYINEVTLLQSYGMTVLVTLHHFTNPMWFERKGAFMRVENVPIFLRFVEKVVTAFGGLVNEYITINEPNVYAAHGYFFGAWPPGEKSFFKAVRVMSVMGFAHIRAYEKIHALRRGMGLTDTMVSFANHLRVFAPENPRNFMHRLYARATERFFQGALSVALCTGRFSFPLRNLGGVKRGKYCDFHALNYYTRSTVSGLRDGVRAGAPVNDLGWEIYPAGIVECAQMLHDITPLPIYVMENGTCDNDDRFRTQYLYDHIRAVNDSPLPIQRYYHWCFCDNFEWVEGEAARFGIVHIDYETQARTVKKSGEFLHDLIKNGGYSYENV